MPNSIKELVDMISERDNISVNEAQNLVEGTALELEEAFFNGSLDLAEDIMRDNLGLEPDYLMLFIN